VSVSGGGAGLYSGAGPRKDRANPIWSYWGLGNPGHWEGTTRVRAPKYPWGVYDRTPLGYIDIMPGYEMSKEQLLTRLRRVEGQVRGLQQMVEADRYCVDVLTQISAVTKALQSVAVGMLDDHLRHCVADAVATGGPEADRKLSEATAAIDRLLKS
jgi:DNA-binding FrmR family transcriptional regulator